MTTDTVYELRVSRDGIPDTDLQPCRRFAGAVVKTVSGILAAASKPGPMAQLRCLPSINGRSAGSQRIIVGGSAENKSQFSDIVFGTLDQGGGLIGNGSILPLGDIATARFLYANMPLGLPWSAIWYYGGVEVARTSDIWSDASHGAKVIRVAPNGGLLPGNYRWSYILTLCFRQRLTSPSPAGLPVPCPRFLAVSDIRQLIRPQIARRRAPASLSFPTSIPRYSLSSIGINCQRARRGHYAGLWMTRRFTKQPALG